MRSAATPGVRRCALRSRSGAACVYDVDCVICAYVRTYTCVSTHIFVNDAAAVTTTTTPHAPRTRIAIRSGTRTCVISCANVCV